MITQVRLGESAPDRPNRVRMTGVRDDRLAGSMTRVRSPARSFVRVAGVTDSELAPLNR
jgi:hypothetical protein